MNELIDKLNKRLNELNLTLVEIRNNYNKLEDDLFISLEKLKHDYDNSRELSLEKQKNDVKELNEGESKQLQNEHEEDFKGYLKYCLDLVIASAQDPEKKSEQKQLSLQEYLSSQQKQLNLSPLVEKLAAVNQVNENQRCLLTQEFEKQEKDLVAKSHIFKKNKDSIQDVLNDYEMKLKNIREKIGTTKKVVDKGEEDIHSNIYNEFSDTINGIYKGINVPNKVNPMQFSVLVDSFQKDEMSLNLPNQELYKNGLTEIKQKTIEVENEKSTFIDADQSGFLSEFKSYEKRLDGIHETLTTITNHLQNAPYTLLVIDPVNEEEEASSLSGEDDSFAWSDEMSQEHEENSLNADNPEDVEDGMENQAPKVSINQNIVPNHQESLFSQNGINLQIPAEKNELLNPIQENLPGSENSEEILIKENLKQKNPLIYSILYPSPAQDVLKTKFVFHQNNISKIVKATYNLNPTEFESLALHMLHHSPSCDTSLSRFWNELITSIKNGLIPDKEYYANALEHSLESLFNQTKESDLNARRNYRLKRNVLLDAIKQLVSEERSNELAVKYPVSIFTVKEFTDLLKLEASSPKSKGSKIGVAWKNDSKYLIPLIAELDKASLQEFIIDFSNSGDHNFSLLLRCIIGLSQERKLKEQRYYEEDDRKKYKQDYIEVFKNAIVALQPKYSKLENQKIEKPTGTSEKEKKKNKASHTALTEKKMMLKRKEQLFTDAQDDQVNLETKYSEFLLPKKKPIKSPTMGFFVKKEINKEVSAQKSLTGKRNGEGVYYSDEDVFYSDKESSDANESSKIPAKGEALKKMKI